MKTTSKIGAGRRDDARGDAAKQQQPESDLSERESPADDGRQRSGQQAVRAYCSN